MKEYAISMEPVKEKLRNLQEYMPDGLDIIYDFGKYLADKLPPKLVPIGFNIATGAMINALEAGVDEVSGEPIRNSLTGYDSIAYYLLREIVPDIAEAVCPEDFAKDVKKIYEQVNVEMQKKSRK